MAGFRRASVFIAPQTRRWKWLAADAPLFYRATNTQVENGWLQTRLFFIAPQSRRWKLDGFRRASFLSRHKHAGGKWLASDAPLFYRATNTQVENGCFQTRLLFYRATITQVENGSVRLESKADTFTPRLYRRTMRVPLALNP